MEFRQLHPEPRTVDSADLYADLGLNARAHEERPWLVVNFATTADGRVTIDGRSGPIGDDGDTELFRRLRGQVDALLVGTGTLAAERYGPVSRRPEVRAAREALGLVPEPPIVTLTRSGVLPEEIPLYDAAESHLIVFTTPDAPEPPHAAATITLIRLDPAELTPTTVLRRLRAEHNIHSLLCEGGPTLFGALLRERLVDELFLTLAPQLAGGGTGPSLTEGAALAEPAGLRLEWVLERNASMYLRYAVSSA